TLQGQQIAKQIMNQQTKLRVAVVGGGIGKSHIMAFQKLPDQFELSTFCDIDADKARSVAETFNIPRITTSLDEACRDPRIADIDICTPPHLHFEQSAQVLQSSKHAICEKPLVGSLKDTDALKTIEASSGKCLMPIFQYRFGRGLQKLKFLTDRGLAGTAYV